MHVYCDQILRGTNRQDGVAVAGLLEVFLLQLRRNIPSIQSVSVQSDNAAYYHAKELHIALPYIGLATGIRLNATFTRSLATGRVSWMLTLQWQ